MCANLIEQIGEPKRSDPWFSRRPPSDQFDPKRDRNVPRGAWGTPSVGPAVQMVEGCQLPLCLRGGLGGGIADADAGAGEVGVLDAALGSACGGSA